MHEVIEGTLQLSLKQLFLYLIQKERLFTVETLNEKIQSFDYGQM